MLFNVLPTMRTLFSREHKTSVAGISILDISDPVIYNCRKIISVIYLLDFLFKSKWFTLISDVVFMRFPNLLADFEQSE